MPKTLFPGFCFFVFLFAGSWASAQKAPSVYRISPVTDGALIAGGALTTGLLYAFQDSLLRKRCPCDPNEVNAFDRPAIGNNSAFARTLSDVLVGCAVGVPLLADYLDLGWDKAFVEDAIVFAEVLAVNSGLVNIVKHLVQRPVPLAYSGELANSPEGYRSFYSGHVSTFFSAASAAAMTLSLRYDVGAWPWMVAGSLGATVALARVAGGNHFATDVIVGGLIGTGIGVFIPWWHRHKSPEEKITLAPLEGSVQVLYSKRF